MFVDRGGDAEVEASREVAGHSRGMDANVNFGGGCKLVHDRSLSKGNRILRVLVRVRSWGLVLWCPRNVEGQLWRADRCLRGIDRLRLLASIRGDVYLARRLPRGKCMLLSVFFRAAISRSSAGASALLLRDIMVGVPQLQPVLLLVPAGQPRPRKDEILCPPGIDIHGGRFIIREQCRALRRASNDTPVEGCEVRVVFRTGGGRRRKPGDGGEVGIIEDDGRRLSEFGGECKVWGEEEEVKEKEESRGDKRRH
jgi:hypothetical protein